MFDIIPESNPYPAKPDDPLREAVVERKKQWRPKGSTNEKAHKVREKCNQHFAAITEEHATELTPAKHEH